MNSNRLGSMLGIDLTYHQIDGKHLLVNSKNIAIRHSHNNDVMYIYNIGMCLALFCLTPRNEKSIVVFFLFFVFCFLPRSGFDNKAKFRRNQIVAGFPWLGL